jgi:hypothetical protein
MRKIEEQIIKAWYWGENKTISNTKTDGASIFLHGNEIIRRTENGVEFSFCGWSTVTTKSRINAVLSWLNKGYVYQKNYNLYYEDSKGNVTELDPYNYYLAK